MRLRAVEVTHVRLRAGTGDVQIRTQAPSPQLCTGAPGRRSARARYSLRGAVPLGAPKCGTGPRPHSLLRRAAPTPKHRRALACVIHRTGEHSAVGVGALAYQKP